MPNKEMWRNTSYSSIISFDAAQTLTKGSFDILVFEPSTGSCWRFDEKEKWSYKSHTCGFDEIKNTIGIKGLQEEYMYIWIHTD